MKNLVSDIEQKANQLVSKLNKLELENRQLRSKLDQAETMLDMQKKKTKDLENKNSILKVSGSLNRNGDKQERHRDHISVCHGATAPSSMESDSSGPSMTAVP